MFVTLLDVINVLLTILSLALFVISKEDTTLILLYYVLLDVETGLLFNIFNNVMMETTITLMAALLIVR